MLEFVKGAVWGTSTFFVEKVDTVRYTIQYKVDSVRYALQKHRRSIDEPAHDDELTLSGLGSDLDSPSKRKQKQEHRGSGCRNRCLCGTTSGFQKSVRCTIGRPLHIAKDEEDPPQTYVLPQTHRAPSETKALSPSPPQLATPTHSLGTITPFSGQYHFTCCRQHLNHGEAMECLIIWIIFLIIL
eukprot:7668586-Pyramimonas_sp.AAC.2